MDHGFDSLMNEAEALRRQLGQLLREVRATVAHPVRPEPLRQAIVRSQQMLKAAPAQ